MNDGTPLKAVVIGASAGAIDALSHVLSNLPEHYALSIFIVVHIPQDKKSVMASVIQTKCKLPVFEAEDKMPIVAGNVYLAPPDYHLLIERNGLLSLSTEEAVHYSRPSIDVLFETAADVYGKNLTGVILTGANDDGAAGLAAIRRQGGLTIVQDPKTAYARTMPESALKLCPDAQVLTLSGIGERLSDLSK